MSYIEFKPIEKLFRLAKCKPRAFICANDYEHLIQNYYDTVLLPEIQRMKESQALMPNIIRRYENRARLIIEQAKFDYELLLDTASGKIANCMHYIRTKFTDPRSKSRIVYPLDSLVIVILLAYIYGQDNAELIANFYKKNNLALQLLVPGLPDSEYMLSKSTINTALRLIDKEFIERLLKEYFSAIQDNIDKLITYNDDKYKDICTNSDDSEDDNLMDTLAFDGQEMRSSYKKGESCRRIKGGNIVTLFDCSNRVSKAYEVTDKKNNETRAFLHIASNTYIEGSVVMSDALNTSADVTNLIIEKGAFYLMPVKAYRGNKELKSHIEAIFNREHKSTLRLERAYKDHGRIEESLIEILPANMYIDERIKNIHSNLNTIVKYSKTTVNIIDGKPTSEPTVTTRYYISSLPFEGDKTLKQVWSSIRDYWFIEQAHNTLDGPLFNQDQLQCCNDNSISNHAGLNKIRMNILGGIRQELTKALGKSTPVSYRYTQEYINELSVFDVYEYLARYCVT